MANINLRLYGEQIYPNISKYLSKYISPDIKKDEFLTMYKSGLIEFDKILLKESLSVYPQIYIEEASISNIKMNIPNEVENFGIFLYDTKCLLTISEIDENEIGKLLIEEKKKLIEGFINYSVKKVQKKDGPSFLDNIIKSVVEKIINGLTIEIHNLELKIKTKNDKNIFFVFLIEYANYSFDKGIQIKNINLLYQEDPMKINVIDKFDIIIDIKSSEDKVKPNQINMTISDNTLKINQKIFFAISKILYIFDEASYKKIYIKYKKLILFHKPKIKENGKKDYISLWNYAIRTVIKLQKYIKFQKYYIFDLLNASQIKIIHNYLEKNKIDEILLSDNQNALKATKRKVEKKILDDKNSNVLANAFSFFFGGKKEEKKNELTEEEKEIFEDIFQDSNINKYLNNEIEDTSNNFNIISQKIKSFLSNFTFNFELTKFQLNLLNKNEIYDINLFINSLKFNIDYLKEQFEFNFMINDIGYKNDTSFFNKKEEKNAIEIAMDKNNIFDLKLAFENVEIKINDFLGIFNFLNSIKKVQKQKIFHENLNLTKENKQEDIYKQLINKISNFSFKNNLKITNIPSLSILNKNNKIDLKIFNYSLKENSIDFTININDSFGKILNDLTFNIIRKDRSFISKIETPIEIFIQNETLSSIALNYFEYKTEVLKENEQRIKDYNIPLKDDKLFDLNYIPTKVIDFGKINIDEYIFDFSIKKFDLKIYKEKKYLDNSFLLEDLQLMYEKKNLNILYNSLIITINLETNLLSNIYKSEQPLIETDDNKAKDKKIKNAYIFKNFIEKFNFNGKRNNFIFNSSKMISSSNINDFQIYKNKESEYTFLFNNLNCNISFPNLGKNSKNIIFKVEKQLTMKYEKITNFIKAEINSLFLNADLKLVKELFLQEKSLNKNTDISFIKNKENYKLDLNINNIKYEIGNNYNLIITKFNINNKKDKNKNISNLEIQLDELVMNNDLRLKIIYSDKFILNCNLSSKNENIINLDFKTMDLNISQNDLYFLLNSLKNKQDNIEHSDEEINKTNNNLLLNYEENKDSNEIEKIDKKYEDINSIPFASGKKGKVLKLDISLINVELNFCNNNTYEKIVSLLMNNLRIQNEIILGANSFNQYFSIFDLDLIYYNEVNENYNILTKRKDKNCDKQIELKFVNDNFEINVNNNEINLRIDVFLKLYYYFQEIDSLAKTSAAINDALETNKSFTICFNNSKFQLSTSFEGKENLYLEINNFIINYKNMQLKFPYGNYDLSLNNLSAKIILKNSERKLFKSKSQENFLRFQFNYCEDIISSNIFIGDLLINLSYRDFVSFLRVYLLNIKLINSSMKIPETKIINKYEKDGVNSKIEKTPGMNSKGNIRALAGELVCKNISITLIDDSKGSYQPFLNFSFEETYLNFNPDNSFFANFIFRLSSYNYIACVWEPVIEKLPIKSNGIYKNKYELNIAIDKLLINLSDMAISFTLVTFNNWLTKLELKTKKFENKEIIFNNENYKKTSGEHKNITKITNNQIINYTGIDLKVFQNEKEILCPSLQKVELDNSNLNEFEDIRKQKHIRLIYDKEHQFEIPLEKIISLKHKIDENIFIISENSLSENKTINISLYSPFIFKNKTPFPLNLVLSNQKYGNSEIILLPNSICGLPLNLFIKNTYFYFLLYETKYYNENNKTENFSLDNLLNSKDGYKRKIDFANKSLTMKLTKKFGCLRILNIYSEYNIVNCLPCDISVEYFNKKFTIEKCSQHFITDNYYNKLFIELAINTDFGLFTTERINLLDLNDKNNNLFITFRNNQIGKKFILPCLFKKIEAEKVFIIYSELILYNKSGLNLNVNFVDSGKIVCFGVREKINLITSKINYEEEVIQFRCNNYFTKNIKLYKLIQITNNINLNMIDISNNNPFDILIKKKSSYIKISNNPNFKERIISIVFTVLPMCRIFNLLSTKKFLICDSRNINKKNSILAISPLQSINFQFFNQGIKAVIGINVINLNANNYSNFIKFQFNIGIYTLATDEYIFNLDIKKNPISGCLEVYILENNIKNSQTIIENLSEEPITISQKYYEKNIQILYPKEFSPLKIYDFYNKEFIFETLSSKIEVNISTMKNCHKGIALNSKSIAVFQDNGIKMKITFYSIEKYNKAKSNLIYINNKIYINTIYISIIGDNEYKHPKLTNYNRYELLLFYITNLNLILNITQTTGLLNKNLIKSKLIVEKLRIYNQYSLEGKFPCILKNEETPCIQMENEINFYVKQNILNFEKQIIKINKIILGIDPDFWRIFLTFYDNVLYRMDLEYFNVSKVFLKKLESDPKKLVKKHMKGRLLINAINLAYPELEIKYNLAENGLENLLKERIACSDFYIWVAKGLVGSTQDLVIEESSLDFQNGTIVQYFIWLYYEYLEKIQDRLTKVGFKGILGQFKNFITLDILNEEKNNINFQKKRIREIRPFYEKFKYFKEYDRDEAILIKNTISRDKNDLLCKYYPTKIIKEKKSFFLFTAISMFHIDSSNYKIMWNVDYFSIKNAISKENKVKVFYNQKIDNYDSCSFKCENEQIAKEVADSLNEESFKNKENILEI